MAIDKKASLQGLTEDEIEKKAFSKILASASIAEQSTSKMRAKLEASGYPDASINNALEKACDLGIIDDRRYCECLIRSTLASGKGLSFVIKEIESIGIDIDTLDAYQDYLESGKDSLIENALNHLAKHPPRSKNPYASCYRKLVSRGFSHEIASDAARAYIDSL